VGKTLVVLLILVTLSSLFADEDENSNETKSIVFQWPLFNNHLEFININLHTIFSSNRNNSSTIFTNMSENIANTEVIVQDKISWLGFLGAMAIYGRMIWGDYYNNPDYQYLGDMWDKKIKEDALYQRIIRTNR
jgi:hypothetical protein